MTPPSNSAEVQIQIGTRGSPLALWQARAVKQALLRHLPETVIDIQVIKTLGDKDLTTPLSDLPTTGYFTKELEQALVSDEIDIAVHSLKDMAAVTAAPLRLAAVLPRGRAEDALLLNPRHRSLADLPSQPFFLTGSIRRQRQLAKLYPGCRIEHVRGNIQTRIAQVSEQNADALVVAAAAIDRLEIKDQNVVIIPIADMIPAAGQGAIAAVCLESRSDMVAALAPLNDGPTRAAVDIERHITALLEGGCSQPLGVHVYPENGGMGIWAGYFPEDSGAAQIVHESTNADDAPATVAAGIAGQFNI
ncbi:MAG: hydroxymethylbilane synthase [Candidatus Marinimicrobia bacterium]|nr:hydroxymethylbilane synthase [Candidatus Neomarinimicrobiota bacterium]